MERTVLDSHYKENQMNAKLFSLSLLTAGVLLANAGSASASGYKFTDLGTFNGQNNETMYAIRA